MNERNRDSLLLKAYVYAGFDFGVTYISMNKHFSEKLKSLRKKKGLTQDSLAEILGKSVRYIQKLESGKSDPSFSVMIEICQILEASIIDFAQQGFLSTADYCCLDGLPSAVQVIDTSGVITYCNQAYSKLLKRPKENLLQKNFLDFVAHKNEVKGIKDYLKFLVEKQPMPTPYISTIKDGDGIELKIEVNWHYLRDDEDKVIGFISVIRKI